MADQIALLLAQRNQFEAESDLAVSETQQAENLARLYRESGDTMPLPPPEKRDTKTEGMKPVMDE